MPIIKNVLGEEFIGEYTNDNFRTYDALNNESSSPLYHRIMFGSDKIKKGYQENQMSKIFKLYGVKKFYDNTILTSKEHQNNAISTFITIVDNYLSAWEDCSNVSFQNPSSNTITKISGLRYLFFVFSDICSKLITRGEKLTKENFKKIIYDFPKALELENVKCVFCDDEGSNTSDDMAERSYSFRGKGATIALAKKDIQRVIAYDNNTTNGGSLI